MKGYGFIALVSGSNLLIAALVATWNAAVIFLWAFALTYGVALARSRELIQ